MPPEDYELFQTLSDEICVRIYVRDTYEAVNKENTFSFILWSLKYFNENKAYEWSLERKKEERNQEHTHKPT